MSKKKFDVYLEFNYTHLNICVLDLLDNHIIYKKNQFYKSYIDSKELNFDELYKLVEDNIFEVEKSTNEFIKDSINGMKELLTDKENNETDKDLFPMAIEDRESYPCSYCSFQTICYD